MPYSPLARAHNFNEDNLGNMLGHYKNEFYDMIWSDVNQEIEKTFSGYTATYYQVYGQLGVEYKERSNINSFRVQSYLKNFSTEKLTDYLKFWTMTYYTPNAKIKSDDKPIIIFVELAKLLLNSSSVPKKYKYEEFCKIYFNNSLDILLNVLKSYSILINYDDNLKEFYILSENESKLQILITNIEKYFPIPIGYLSPLELFERYSLDNFNKFYSKVVKYDFKKAKNIIYFGSPGTGKSHSLEQDTKGFIVERVIFHPEYDYHSFVGVYKPTMSSDGKIIYKFVPQVFIKAYINAWKNLTSSSETQNYCILVEEINRGNCAQIFGDLFQLLDRDKDGYSKYGISIDEDLKKYLIEELGEGHQGLEGDKIKLPCNLSIMATMNTSDQSLFPMDSAFKRRWEWKYVPIDYECEKSNKFIIKLTEDKQYKWLDFLNNINKIISDVTFSHDKQIGNWFVNAEYSDNIIDKDTFVNKVLFYLWNDVFKDEDNSIFIDAQKQSISYEDFFSENSISLIEQVLNNIDVKPNSGTSE